MGESFEKKPIWFVSLTNITAGFDIEKPAVWLDANIHTTEITGTTVLLHLIYTILTGYGKAERLTHLLDTCVYYIVPRLNPDGAMMAMLEKPKYIRSGVRWYPWEEKQDGLHEENVDGDGRLLQMRILDPNGDWKISELDPRLMQKRSPVEYGSEYYRILPEGIIHDYNEFQLKIAQPPEGLDFNRNFPSEAGIKDRKFINWFREHPHEEDLLILKWVDKNAPCGSYVDWYDLKHPQLGRVELGGWNRMYTWRNPPVDFLFLEVERNTPFALMIGELLPKLSVKILEVAPLGNGDYRINLVVDNTGFLPTFTSEQGKKKKIVRPVRVELEFPEGVKLVIRKQKTEMGYLQGRSNKLDVMSLWDDEASTDNHGRVEWVINGSSGSIIKVHILSERAGSIHQYSIIP